MPRTPSGDGGSNGASDASLIPFSRFRASLARARTRRRADELLDRADVAQLVPTLPVQELFYAIKEVGLQDAAELIGLATPEQIQGFVDLDTWRKDTFLDDRLSPWLDILIDSGPDKLLKAISGLDGEVLALYLSRRMRVYDLEVEAPPEESEGHYYPTPDTFYILDILVDGEEGKRVERLIDWLYRAHLLQARKIIMSAKWELAADLEEFAYRWRSGRMADLGYTDYYEALEVYRWLDPATVKVGEGSEEVVAEPTTLPAEFVASMSETGLLGRALARIDDPGELDRVSSSLLMLVNRVMAADAVDPGDLAAAREALDRTVSCLGLGLEYLSRGDEARASEALATVALARVFRVGFSLTLKLQKAADTLVERAWVSLVPGKATLLDPPIAEAILALRQPRPMLHPAFFVDEQERQKKQGGTRPFRTLGELAAAARAVEQAAQLGDTIRRGLGVMPSLLEPALLAPLHVPPDLITFATLVATLAANLLLDRPPLLVPLVDADLATLRERALEGNALRPTARLQIARAFDIRLEEREFRPPESWDRWLDGWLRHLEEALLISLEGADRANLLVRR